MRQSLLKSGFYGLLQVTGAIAAWRWLRRDMLTVVCIHGVVSEQGGTGLRPTRFQLPVAELDRQLAILTRRYQFVSLDDARRVLRQGKLGSKPCALFTIDDGYKSAWEQAWPILKRHGVPAVVFVATKHMETGQLFWWDRLDYAVLHMPGDVKEINLGPHALPVDLSSREARSRSARFITRKSRDLFENETARFEALESFIRSVEQTEWHDDLKSWVGVMTAEDVAAASAIGFEIGSHTVNHYRLGDLDRDAVRDELRDSKTAIENITGRPCRSFCFPEGSLNAVSQQEVEDAGYELAFCSESGLNGGTDRVFALRRIHLPSNGSTASLLARVSGLSLAISGIMSRLAIGRS